MTTPRPYAELELTGRAASTLFADATHGAVPALGYRHSDGAEGKFNILVVVLPDGRPSPSCQRVRIFAAFPAQERRLPDAGEHFLVSDGWTPFESVKTVARGHALLDDVPEPAPRPVVAQPPAPRPASLRFRSPADPPPLRTRMLPEPFAEPFHRAAIAWATVRLRGPVVHTPSSLDGARLGAVRQGLGELQRLTVTASSLEGTHESAGDAGPNRVFVELTARGNLDAAELTLLVAFPDGLARPPTVELAAAHLLARPLPPAPATVDEVELSEAICAAPEDDAPRAQLAAVWIARGEPRGEFVRAQLAGDEDRADALLREHGEHWTDGLPVARDGRIYRRGFLSEAIVRCSPFDFAAAIHNPAWSLLSTLHLGIPDRVQEDFLTRARLTSLRRITGLTAETLEAIPLPPQICHVHARGRVHERPAGIESFEIETFAFADLWVFARQHDHSELALLSVSVHRELNGEDLLVIHALLAPPRPATLVLSGPHPQGQRSERWRLEVIADIWDFRGDPQVLQQLRDAADAL